MADDTTYKPAASRIASNKELAEQNAELDAEIEREAEERHAAKHRHRASAQKTSEKIKRVEASAASAMQGFDPLRPVRMVVGFTKGTIMGTLGGVGTGAKYGFYAGAFFGVLGCIAGGMTIAPLALGVGFIGMSVVGALLGGALGMAFGGIRGVSREMKREKNEEDAAKTQQVGRSSARLGSAQRAHVADSLEEEQRKRSELNFDRSRQQDLENQKDNQTYWQDRVSSEANGWGMGRN